MGSVFALRLSSARFLALMDLDHPVQVTRFFTTLADGQRKAIFDFCFRKGPESDWQPVGKVQWDLLPAGRAGEPTLELSLIPGREDDLLLQIKERSSGATRSYSVRLPALRRPPPLARAHNAAPPAPAAARAEPTAPVPLAAPPRRPFRKWLAVAAVAAAAALAGAALALFRFAPLRELLPAGPAGGGTVQRPAPAAVKAPEPQPARPLPKPQPQPARPQAARSEPQPAQEGPPLLHRVQWGDTLWRITERYYGNPDLYDLLAGENALADPNLLITGTELRLPPRIDDQERKQ